MPFDFHDIGQVGAGGAAGGVVGYITYLYNKFITDKKFDSIEKYIKTVDDRHDALALLIAKEYITRHEIKEDFAEIKQALKEINSKLDQKVDK